MKRIAKSVARQTGQLARDVAKQTLKDIGEIPKQAPRQAVGQTTPAGAKASKQKLVNLPSLKGIDVKEEVGKVPKTAAKQVAGPSPIVEAMQQSDGKTQLLTTSEEQKLESETLRRKQSIDAEMAQLREERKRREEERLTVPVEEKVVGPSEPIQLPSSPPRGPKGPQQKGPEVRKSKH